MQKDCTFEKISSKIYALCIGYRLPFISGVIAGLAAHMFALTNKLLNADEVGSLFAKGALCGSGRWGLILFEPLFPSYSMPWLWGFVSIVLISLAACITVSIFKIKSPVSQGLLAAMMTCLPSVTGTFCFMFTSTMYFFALFVGTLSIYTALSDWKWKWPAAGFLLIIMMGTYQAYVLVAASFFVIYLIRELIEDGKSAKSIFIEGVKYVVLLIVSMIIYYIVSRIVIIFTGDHFVEYAFSDNSIPQRVIMAYTSFLGMLFKGYFGFVSNSFSKVLHAIFLLAAAYSCVVYCISQKDIYKKLLFILCIILLPLSINGMYLIAGTTVIYAPVLFSFISIYLFAIVVNENVKTDKKAAVKSVLDAALTLIIIVNIVFANKVYLKEYLMYEEAHAFYTGVVAQLQQCEGFDENSKVAIVGETDNIYRPDEIDFKGMFSPAPANFDLVNIYTKDMFIKYYVGFDLNFVPEEEIDEVTSKEEFAQMACYPYYGSVKLIDDIVVVKLGN